MTVTRFCQHGFRAPEPSQDDTIRIVRTAQGPRPEQGVYYIMSHPVIYYSVLHCMIISRVSKERFCQGVVTG